MGRQVEAEETEPRKTLGLLNRLDGLGDWRFLACLWLARWAIILPMTRLGGAELPPISASDLIGFVLSAVILSPLVETLLECRLGLSMRDLVVLEREAAAVAAVGIHHSGGPHDDVSSSREFVALSLCDRGVFGLLLRPLRRAIQNPRLYIHHAVSFGH